MLNYILNTPLVQEIISACLIVSVGFIAFGIISVIRLFTLALITKVEKFLGAKNDQKD